MAYVVVHDKDNHCSVALQMRHGKHMAEFVTGLNKVARQGIEVVTISRPAAYGEYAPYTIAGSEDDLYAFAQLKNGPREGSV